MPLRGEATRESTRLSQVDDTVELQMRTAPWERGRPAAARDGEGLGERLRRLRVAAGLTQSELAGGRFSKEYVSQIERGKTRPTGETVRWLAERLGIDPSFLSGGIA